MYSRSLASNCGAVAASTRPATRMTMQRLCSRVVISMGESSLKDEGGRACAAHSSTFTSRFEVLSGFGRGGVELEELLEPRHLEDLPHARPQTGQLHVPAEGARPPLGDQQHLQPERGDVTGRRQVYDDPFPPLVQQPGECVVHGPRDGRVDAPLQGHSPDVVSDRIHANGHGGEYYTLKSRKH